MHGADLKSDLKILYNLYVPFIRTHSIYFALCFPELTEMHTICILTNCIMEKFHDKVI